MAMENLMKALMESAMQGQQPAAAQQATGGDALSQVLGGLIGGAQQQSGGGDMLTQVVGGLLGGGAQQAGGMLGAAPQQGGGSGDMLLGALEGLIGGQPGGNQMLNANQATGLNLNANDPIMMLLQPVVNQVAAKLNISPQIATVVASIALHYLLSSHPSTSPKAPMDLGSVMQQLAGGGISQGVLTKSGMVTDVMQATGLNKQQALNSLNTTFGVLGAQAQGALKRPTG